MKKLKNPSSSIGVGKVIGMILKLIFFVLLVGVFVIVYNIYSEFTDDGGDDYDSLKQAIVQFGNDLNEMQDYLYLPQTEYNFFQTDAEVDPEKFSEIPEDKKHIEGVEKFIETLTTQQSLEENQARARENLEGLISDETFVEGLAELELTAGSEMTVDEEYGRSKINNAEGPLVQLLLDIESGKLSVQSVLGIDVLTSQEDDLIEPIVEYLKENKENILDMKTELESKKTEMKTLLEDEKVNETINQNSLRVNVDPIETADGFEYYVMDSNDSPLLTILLDRKTGELVWDGTRYSEVADVEDEFLNAVSSLNGETDQVKAIKQKQEELEAFLDNLDTGDLTVAPAREEEGKTYYDLTQKTEGDEELENKVGTIIFDLGTGEMTFIEGSEGDDAVMYDLDELLSGSKKKP